MIIPTSSSLSINHEHPVNSSSASSFVSFSFRSTFISSLSRVRDEKSEPPTIRSSWLPLSFKEVRRPPTGDSLDPSGDLEPLLKENLFIAYLSSVTWVLKFICLSSLDTTSTYGSGGVAGYMGMARQKKREVKISKINVLLSFSCSVLGSLHLSSCMPPRAFLSIAVLYVMAWSPLKCRNCRIFGPNRAISALNFIVKTWAKMGREQGVIKNGISSESSFLLMHIKPIRFMEVLIRKRASSRFIWCCRGVGWCI